MNDSSDVRDEMKKLGILCNSMEFITYEEGKMYGNNIA